MADARPQVAAELVKANILNTINFLLEFSDVIRDLVRGGQLEIIGGLFDLQTGRVDFLGPSPDQAALLDPMASKGGAPLSQPSLSQAQSQSQNLAQSSEPREPRSTSTASAAGTPAAALKRLQEGNARFTLGSSRLLEQKELAFFLLLALRHAEG